jgi:hypothetical protein
VRTPGPGSPYHQPYAVGRVARVTSLLTRETYAGIAVHMIGLLPWDPETPWWTSLDHTEPATEDEWIAQRILDQIER